MASQMILVLDFGGQYNQLIARRVRECSVYCEVRPYTTPVAEIKTMAPIGIIFTGGPNSVYDPASPQADPEIFKLGIPILGICYGCQLMAQALGGQVPGEIDHGRVPRALVKGNIAVAIAAGDGRSFQHKKDLLNKQIVGCV